MSVTKSDISAIVVEGGGMRGIFSAGVLDAFLQRDFHPFQLAIGSSAGACNLASYLARQLGRNRRCYMQQMMRPEAISVGRYLRGGHLLDLDYLWDAFDREDPLDVPAALSNPAKLIVCLTGVDTGEAVYLEPTEANLLATLKASCALPLVYRSSVTLENVRYADGGVAAALPVEEAWRRGARRILVVRSRPVEYTKEPRLETVVGAMALRGAPRLSVAVRRSHESYRRSLEFIRKPPAECRIHQVAPTVPLQTRRISRNVGALLQDYAAGQAAGEQAIREWSESR